MPVIKIEHGPLKNILLLVLFLLCTNVYSKDVTNQRWLQTASELGLAAGLELFGKDHLIPDKPRISTPNKFDAHMRDKLWLGVAKQDVARKWSDRLIYGVSMSSLVWSPALSKESSTALLINGRVFAVNSLMTNLVKIGTARERPYSFYQTRRSEGNRDYASFYSGHSSVAFSQAVTNALLLTRDYPDHETLIWSSLLGTAGLTGYLRVAGDMHYFSDVLTGAITGSLVAWFITKIELRKFDEEHENDTLLYQKRTNGSKFMVSLKIPLG